jgi:hypothetical protein
MALSRVIRIGLTGWTRIGIALVYVLIYGLAQLVFTLIPHRIIALLDKQRAKRFFPGKNQAFWLGARLLDGFPLTSASAPACSRYTIVQERARAPGWPS